MNYGSTAPSLLRAHPGKHAAIAVELLTTSLHVFPGLEIVTTVDILIKTYKHELGVPRSATGVSIFRAHDS